MTYEVNINICTCRFSHVNEHDSQIFKLSTTPVCDQLIIHSSTTLPKLIEIHIYYILQRTISCGDSSIVSSSLGKISRCLWASTWWACTWDATCVQYVLHTTPSWKASKAQRLIRLWRIRFYGEMEKAISNSQFSIIAGTCTVEKVDTHPWNVHNWQLTSCNMEQDYKTQRSLHGSHNLQNCGDTWRSRLAWERWSGGRGC